LFRFHDALIIDRWKPALADKKWAHVAVMHALTTLPNPSTFIYFFLTLLFRFHDALIIDSWKPALADKKWAHVAVMHALTTLPNLLSLSVEWGSQIKIPFHLFTTLRHVSVKCEDKGTTFENLTKMILQSPLLESIDFMNFIKGRSGYSGTDRRRSLRQLFERYPEDIPPLRLKHLSLAHCLVRLDDETVMRHLRYLTSFSLEGFLHPFPSGDA
jgi:hypothetical protein